MTSYRRRGHYRRGRNGQRVWVSSHMVTRRSSQRYAPPPAKSRPRRTPARVPRPPAPPRVTTPRVVLPYSSRWAHPNAVCPVCGAKVYFYANDAGSRVYFDEIGPPWPKHPCTDTFIGRVLAVSTQTLSAPGFHTRAETKRAYSRARRARQVWRSQLPSGEKVNTSREAFEVEQALHNERGTLLHLRRLHEESAREAWGTPGRVLLTPGQLVFIDDGWLSYVERQQVQIVRFPVYFQYLIKRSSILRRFVTKLTG